MLRDHIHKPGIQHFLSELWGLSQVGTYVLRICFLLGIITATLHLALVCSAFSHWISGVVTGRRSLRLFSLTPAEVQHLSHWFYFSFKQIKNLLLLNKLSAWREIGWDVHWRGAKVFQTWRPPLMGKGSTSWVNGEDVVGWSYYTPAVKNKILRGRGLTRLGRGVPMVITMVTRGLSQEMAAGGV